MRYRELAMSGATELAGAGVAKIEAALDARLLLQHVAEIDRAGLISREGDLVPTETVARYEAAIARRAAGEPVSRIVGERAFFGLTFKVTSDVLDPRPETEVLVERVLSDLDDRQAPLRFADIGTGSGAIAVALLAHMPQARCVAVDISQAALDVASANARAHGVAGRFEPRQGSFVEGLAGSFDFMVSNPPYIPAGDISGLSREVREHDPLAALDGGADGLDAYRALLASAGGLIGPGGGLYLEIGAGQAGRIGELAVAGGWRVDDVVSDLSGIDRVVVARMP